MYGKSSGASLALQAASALGGKVKKLALYEAPYSEAEGAAKEWREFRAKLDALLAADRRADAVTLFMKFVGAPDEAIAKMKASPAWPGMVAMAPTLAYDNAVLGDDRSVPVESAAKVKAATLVMDGGASLGPMPFMRTTADKLGKAIPGAQRHVVEGQAHDVSSKVLAPVCSGPRSLLRTPESESANVPDRRRQNGSQTRNALRAFEARREVVRLLRLPALRRAATCAASSTTSIFS